MATVTGLTADRMLAIEAASVVDGDVVGDNLVLTTKGGTQINAGNVRGPAGAQGPIGQDLSVLAQAPVLDVGMLNQIRAGHQLAPTDFAGLGLGLPAGLWNLSDLSDASGNGRALTNKGAVPFGLGINGLSATAARFSGSTGQVLYIADTGAADPFRIKTGSFGCWFKTAKRSALQVMLAKMGASPVQSWNLYVNTSNQVQAGISIDGNASISLTGTLDLCDDRWHFAVATADGIYLRLYIDGALDIRVPATYIFQSAAPLNVGGQSGDAGTATSLPFYGSIDEAFVTPDILSEDEIRLLYCAKFAHNLGAAPHRGGLSVRRRRRGAALTVADFVNQPVRLHNFSAGSLGDEGSNGVPLVNGPGYPVSAGADGLAGNSFRITGGSTGMSSTDAGLPAALTTRSFGLWFKTASSLSQAIIAWGTLNTGDTRLWISSTGILQALNGADSMNGPFVADGLWHHAVVVEDNTAGDGVRRKLYLDGKLVVGSTVLVSIVLAGANRFHVGSSSDGTNPFNGEVDGAFVCNYALTLGEVVRLYGKAAQDLGISPKNAGDHIERMDATNIYTVFDDIDPQNTVDLVVAA